MTERWDKKLLAQGILDYDAERPGQKQINGMREGCGDTPERFREMVRRAVDIQKQKAADVQEQRVVDVQKQKVADIQKQVNEDIRMQTDKEDLQIHGSGKGTKDWQQKTCREAELSKEPEVSREAELFGESKQRRGKKTGRRWRRIFLPAAAVLALGSMAAAAGGGWLKSYLLKQGFTESEAEALLETEPQQQVTELAGAVFPSGKTMEKEWSSPLLTVREACFDGNTLYFLAEGSGESADYDLYLRDHASVNGKNGLVSLEKLESEQYLGQIDLLEDGSEIMQASSVDVELIIVPYPQFFEGITLYTWKDAEAYEQIFSTGTFQDEYERPCRVIAQKDVIAGYTPQKLSVQVPLTEEAKKIIEEYHRQERPDTSNLITAAGKGDDPADFSERSGYDERGCDAEKSGYDIEENGYSAEGMNGEHISCVISGQIEDFRIDAQVVRQADEIYTGTLRAFMASEEALKALYAEGDPEQWKLTEDTGYYSEWNYQDGRISVSQDIGMQKYNNDEPVPWTGQSGEESAEGEEKRRQEEEICRQVLRGLGIEAQATKEVLPSDGTAVSYILKPVLENLPVAGESQWHSKCIVTLEDGYLRSVSAPGRMEILEKEQVILPKLGDILQSVEKYAAAGEIQTPISGQPVTEISLEYYVDLTAQGIVFRPVWNFKVPYLAEGMEYSMGAANFLYIDALTGALVRDAWGW